MQRFALAVASLLLLAACVPAASVLSRPSFTWIAEDSGLLRIEPPGVGEGTAVIRLAFAVHNPNPFGLNLAGLDGELHLAGRPVVQTRFHDGIALPAQGSGRLVLDVEAPLSVAPGLVSQLARLVGGEPVPFRLDAALTVEVAGIRQTLPPVTVAAGQLSPPAPLRPPRVRFDAATSSVRLEGLTAQVNVGLAIENPSPLGFLLRSPGLELRIDGRTIGRVALPATPVPAGETSHAQLRFEAGVAQMGAALLGRLQGGGSGLRLAIDGEATFDLPGIASLTRTLSEATTLAR